MAVTTKYLPIEHPHLIILRGNSGSGKTTVATMLHQALLGRSLLISHDVIRREMLKVKDYPGNPSIEMIRLMAEYGKSIGFDVIVEGILPRERYAELFQGLKLSFGDRCHAFYFDVAFETTLVRHHSKPNANDFGEVEMRSWWCDKDYLGLANETILSEHMSADEVVDLIVTQIKAQDYSNS